MSDIWDEKPSIQDGDPYQPDFYDPEEVDAWLDTLRGRYLNLIDYKRWWMELRELLREYLVDCNDADIIIGEIKTWKEKAEKWDNFYEKIRPTLEKAEIFETLTPVWVPRGYYSEVKIKDDDVLMYIQENSEFKENSEE